MQLYETFEVKFKDKNSAEQKSLLKNAIIDLYQNFDDYKIVERSKGKKDQTSDFMDKFHITKFDIFNLLDESLHTLNLAKYADILVDRDREDNLLYILYFPNATVGNWDYSKSREKLLYIKWNPINKNIISFHTMRDIQDTNRDSLTENKMKITEEKFEIYNTHVKYRFINRWCNLYYDKVSENLFVLYDGYIETVDQIKPTEFERIYDGYTLCKPTDKIIQIWKRDRKLEEKSSIDIQDVIYFVYTHTDEDFVLTDLEVLKDLKKDLKDGTKPMYELNDVKGIKDDIIQTMELNSEQKKVLNDFMKKVEGLYKDKGKIEEKLKNIKFQNVINENLSYDEIIDKLFYTGNNNAHLKKFYDLKRKYNGKDVSNIKVITADISDEGYCDILFSVKATKDGKKKKELVGENGELRDNISDEYEVILRINDFWDLIDEFGLETKGDFTKADVVALIQLSQDIKIKDSTPSFWWMGTSWYLSQDNASLMPCDIPPKFWNRDNLRPNVKVSKSVEGVLKNLGFFTQQIAMSIKRALKEEGYLM